MSVYLTKKTGEGELETATPAEVAEVLFSNDNTNNFDDDAVDKLNECKKIVFLTQTEYDAIVLYDDEIWYVIRAEI